MTTSEPWMVSSMEKTMLVLALLADKPIQNLGENPKFSESSLAEFEILRIYRWFRREQHSALLLRADSEGRLPPQDPSALLFSAGARLPSSAALVIRSDSGSWVSGAPGAHYTTTRRRTLGDCWCHRNDGASDLCASILNRR